MCSPPPPPLLVQLPQVWWQVRVDHGRPLSYPAVCEGARILRLTLGWFRRRAGGEESAYFPTSLPPLCLLWGDGRPRGMSQSLGSWTQYWGQRWVVYGCHCTKITRYGICCYVHHLFPLCLRIGRGHKIDTVHTGWSLWRPDHELHTLPPPCSARTSRASLARWASNNMT